MQYEKNSKNKIIRGNKRAVYDQEKIFEILDSTFLCHVGIVLEGRPIVIPTSYGREGDVLFLHGAASSMLLNQAEAMKEICVTVTQLDGVVLARTMFNTSANYRSVVMYGKAEWVPEQDKLRTLKVVSDHIIPNRFDEVELGSVQEVKATKVLKFTIETASAKVRAGGPAGDEDLHHTPLWAGHIPIVQTAQKPIVHEAVPKGITLPKSARDFHKNFGK